MGWWSDGNGEEEKPPACLPSPGHFWSWAAKNVANLIGFHAHILTSATTLPCEPTGTFYAHSAAWTGITQANNAKWAQTGYIRRRYQGSPAVIFKGYIEVKSGQGAANYYFSTFPAPAVGTTPSYSGELNQNNGRWTFFFNTVQRTYTNAGWANNSGRTVQYVGEIYDRNSQLVGTAGSRCRFSRCQYKVVGGGLINAGLVAGNLNSSNRAEWDYNFVNATTIEVWDVNP